MKRLIAVIGTLGAFMLVPAMASANGPCGVNYNGPTACGVTAPTTISGTIVQRQESDYYVFWAPAGTQVATTITDTIAPSCTSSGNGCGQVSTYLDDSSGESVSGSSSSTSYYYGGVLLTGRDTVTLDHTGTYYLIVNGEAAGDGNGRGADAVHAQRDGELRVDPVARAAATSSPAAATTGIASAPVVRHPALLRAVGRDGPVSAGGQPLPGWPSGVVPPAEHPTPVRLGAASRRVRGGDSVGRAQRQGVPACSRPRPGRDRRTADARCWLGLDNPAPGGDAAHRHRRQPVGRGIASTGASGRLV